MIDQTSTMLFELLTRSLSVRRKVETGETASSIGTPDRATWLALITQAEQMEVDGLAYDAVLTLPHEQQPDLEVMMRWTANVQSVERDRLLYRQHLTTVLQALEQEGLSPIMLKGEVLSLLYPNALRRPVGDVDLFVPLDLQRRYVQCLKSLGGETQDEYDAKHLTVSCLDLNWELHFRSIFFYNRHTDRRYHLLESEETTEDALCHETFDGHTVKVFPPLLNQVYLTAHIQHHLLMERVTLRQIVDWMLSLHHERIALGIAEIALVRTLRQLGLYRLYRALGYIAGQYLGFHIDDYAGLSNLTKEEAKRGEKLIANILRGHIKGCKPYTPHLPSDGFLKRVNHFIELCKRCIALHHLCPLETLAAPFGFIRYSIKRRQWEREKEKLEVRN